MSLDVVELGFNRSRHSEAVESPVQTPAAHLSQIFRDPKSSEGEVVFRFQYRIAKEAGLESLARAEAPIFVGLCTSL